MCTCVDRKSRESVREMEEKSDQVGLDTVADAAAADTNAKKAAAVTSESESATDTPASAADTVSSDTPAISESGENANEGSVTEVVREAQAESKAAGEQDALIGAVSELTQPSEQPSPPPATTEQTREETEQAGLSNEQDQTAGSPDQSSSEGCLFDAAEQPCPTAAAESVQPAGEGSTQKLCEESTVKLADAEAASEPSQETPEATSLPADAQDHTQSSSVNTESPAHVTTDDKPAVETSTEATKDAKPEPKQDDQGPEAASDAACSPPDAALAQVGLGLLCYCYDDDDDGPGYLLLPCRLTP